MAEAALVRDHLNQRMIDDGRLLVESLDARGIPVTGVLWLFDAESHRWRLIVASPWVSQPGIGPIETLRGIRDVLEALKKNDHSIRLSDVYLYDDKDRLIKTLRRAVRTGRHDVAAIRCTRTWVDGEFIEDGLIYRL